MRIAITGANGLIGAHLTQHFARSGHELTLILRQSISTIHHQSIWNPFAGEITAADLEGQDVVINLAGKNVGAGRWTERIKREILSSRILSTELIAKTIAKCQSKPRLLINASAIGFYGNRPGETLTEMSPPGRGFMAEACQKWEQASQAALAAGIRVVIPRIGVVLARTGGALDRMLPLFRSGLGGKLGSGKQIWSWIALPEIASAFDHIIATATLSDAVNLTTPNPVSNELFTELLAKAVRRPAFFAVPEFALKLAMGEMAQVVLDSANVMPQRLLDSGYKFKYPGLPEALFAVLSED